MEGTINSKRRSNVLEISSFSDSSVGDELFAKRSRNRRLCASQSFSERNAKVDKTGTLETHLMDIIKMLQELRAEREQVGEAILALERLASGGGKRRGRPPKWMSKGAASDGSLRRSSLRKRVVSPEARARMAAGQRKRWAAARQVHA